jgi:hypothetical protein
MQNDDRNDRKCANLNKQKKKSVVLGGELLVYITRTKKAPSDLLLHNHQNTTLEREINSFGLIINQGTEVAVVSP